MKYLVMGMLFFGMTTFSVLAQDNSKINAKEEPVILESTFYTTKTGERKRELTLFTFAREPNENTIMLTINKGGKEKTYRAMVVENVDDYVDLMFREEGSKAKHFIRIWDKGGISLLMHGKDPVNYY